jgi:hypothetical protein
MSIDEKHPSIPLDCNVQLRNRVDPYVICWVKNFESPQTAYRAATGKSFILAMNSWELVVPVAQPLVNPHMTDGVAPPLVTGFNPSNIPLPPAPPPQIAAAVKQADRYNTGKAELSYILSAPSAMEGLAEVFAFGATKYSRNNWQAGFPKEKLVDSLLRHLLAHQNGEVVDAESKMNHLDHVLWNALALADEYNGKRAEKNVRTLS